MYTRPVRILWKFPAAACQQGTDPEAWINYIPSKSTRKLAKNLDALLEELGLTYSIQPMTEELYVGWHAMYSQLMLSQNHEVLAKTSWFADRREAFSEVQMVELLSLPNSHRIGASVLTHTTDNIWSKPYRASERVEFSGHRNLSAGVLVDLLSLRYMFSRNPSAVHSGSSRNAFGHFNNLGYLAYKLKLGYEPWILSKYEIESEFPQTSPESSTAWFVTPQGYAGNDQQLSTLLISPGEEILNEELRAYLAYQNIAVQVK